MILRPVTTEKAVKLVDIDNTLIFEVERRAQKDEVKKEVETLFSVKVENVRSNTRHNRKFMYVKLKKEHRAADVATKLGVL